MKAHATLASSPNLGGMTDEPLGTQPCDAIRGSGLYAGMTDGKVFQTRYRLETEHGPAVFVLRWTTDGRVRRLVEIVRLAPVEAEPSRAA